MLAETILLKKMVGSFTGEVLKLEDFLTGEKADTTKGSASLCIENLVEEPANSSF